MTSPFRKRAFEPSPAIGSSSSSGLKAPKLAFDPIDLDILLPNGGRVIISVAENEKLAVASLIKQIRKRIPKDILESLNWQKVFLEDPAGNKLLDGEFVFSRNDLQTLFLQDGRPNAIHGLEDMWNVTPVPELLGALPQEYTLETALADLLDNSLQAVWANATSEQRLISITVNTDKITIFDNGQGMDSSRENSIAKWGTMGSSSHRGVRALAVGGDPPFLKPYFGMYGFGGLIAAMHLGDVAAVSSKTKSSKKVVTLTLEKDKLMERCKTDRVWKTRGEYREPTTEELKKSTHGSFTKVELSKLKRKLWDENRLQRMLKDIYFPYIQCDISDTSERTTTPVRFEVNETDLAEVEGGEVALTNMHSGNGYPFVIDLHLQKQTQNSEDSENEVMEANASIKCLYFPIRQGKESIDVVLEELEKEGRIIQTFENFPRVSIRRLGRLLPNARWQKLPFMEAKRKKADKATVPKICFDRVKAFIDTDAGFVPTASKLDLLNGDVFTTALQNLCSRRLKPDSVSIDIVRCRKSVKIHDVEREYEDWIKEMHELFDEEVNSVNETEGKFLTLTLKELGFSHEVARLFMEIRRKGILWQSGMLLKFCKGSLPQMKNKDFYAILEYILADGFPDEKGNTKVICRPMEIAQGDGCHVSLKLNMFSLRKSVALSVDLLRPDKCEILHEAEWNRVKENKMLHSPGRIDILDTQMLKDFGLDGGLKCQVKAGTKPFSQIYAVVRSKQFVKQQRDGKCFSTIEQKTIMKESMQMKLKIKTKISSIPCSIGDGASEQTDLDISVIVEERAVKGIHGFYVFSIDSADFKQFYTKAGSYIFTFSLIDGDGGVVLGEILEVLVLPSDAVGKWVLLLETWHSLENHANNPTVRLGSQIGPLSVRCFDEYGNLKAIDDPLDFEFEIWCNRRQLHIDLVVVGVSYEENLVTIKALKLTRGNLRGTDATLSSLRLLIEDEYVSSMDINVLPGEMSSIEEVKCQDLEDCLKTDDIINIYTLQVIDCYGNHVEKGCKVFLELKGLQLQDGQELERTVDECGRLKLGGLLKVTGSFNSSAEIRVYSEGYRLLYERSFSLLKRSLKLASMIPTECHVGDVLHDIEVQITDENGNVDREMSGIPHIITLLSTTKDSYHPVYHGTCTISTIELPNEAGPWCCDIRHIAYEELQLQFKINILPCFEGEMNLMDFIDNDENTENYMPLMIRDCDFSQNNVETEPDDIVLRVEKINKEMKECTSKIQRYEGELDKLNKMKNKEASTISQLQESIKTLDNQSQMFPKSKEDISYAKRDFDEKDVTAEYVAEQLSKVASPASFILESLSEGIFPSSEILGTVALVASTKNRQLSKALAYFIGQDNMLAIVCKTTEAADLLISCDRREGADDDSLGLQRFTKSKNKRVHDKLRIYMLDEMRCYCHEIDERHPQRLLKLEEPRLRNGAIPEGFIGYAVNMLVLNDELVKLKTSKGGLRETLFYHLFKNLQVYETSKHLSRAREALTSGGISLDGTFIHQKRGSKYFGKWEDVDIIFPVYSGRCKIPSIHSLYESLQRKQVEDKLCKKKQDLNKVTESTNWLVDRIEYVKTNIRVYQEKLSECKERKAAIEGDRQKYNELMQKT